MIIGIDASLACREQRTGVESYAFHIIANLASVIPAEIEVRLYSDREFPPDLKKHIPDTWKQVVLSWPPRYLWTQVRLSFEMLQHPPDVFFTPGHVEPILHPRCSAMMVHDVAAWRIPAAYSRFDRWYTLNRTRAALKTNPVVLVPSMFTRQELEAFALSRNTQIKADIRVISHGFIDKHLPISEREDESAAFSTYGIDENTPYILCVGRVEYKKNIDAIAGAFEKLKASSPSYQTLKLVLIGKPGVGYAAIGNKLRQSVCARDIIETGWLPDDQASVLLKNAKVFLFTSKYEGFGFPVLEALSLGVPVIASSGLGLEEVGGTLCTYVSPGSESGIADALRENIGKDSHARQLLRVQGNDWVKRFSWSRSAEETYQALQDAYAIASRE